MKGAGWRRQSAAYDPKSELTCTVEYKYSGCIVALRGELTSAKTRVHWQNIRQHIASCSSEGRLLAMKMQPNGSIVRCSRRKCPRSRWRQGTHGNNRANPQYTETKAGKYMRNEP